MEFKHINKVGVELEGGWSRRPEGYTPDGTASSAGGAITGEVPTPARGTWAEMERDVRRWMPEYVSDDCASHVHFSTKSEAAYMELMDDRRYMDGLVVALRTWALQALPSGHRLFDRLNGNCHWAKAEWRPEMQHADKSRRPSSRYTMVNFCGRLHTVELRVIGAFEQVEQLLACIKVALTYTENYLDRREVPVVEGGASAWTVVKNNGTEQVVVSKHVYTKGGYDAAWHKAKVAFGVARPSSKRWEAGADNAEYRIVAQAESGVAAKDMRIIRIVVEAEMEVSASAA